MPIDQETLQIYETGRLTVVGFGGHDVLDHVNVADFRDEIVSIIEEHRCEVLAFDLTGVTLIPSGLLGLLASLHQLGVEVHLYNPSDDIREVLEITKLGQVMQVHKLEL